MSVPLCKGGNLDSGLRGGRVFISGSRWDGGFS